jgi:hypothetical protein
MRSGGRHWALLAALLLAAAAAAAAQQTLEPQVQLQGRFVPGAWPDTTAAATVPQASIHTIWPARIPTLQRIAFPVWRAHPPTHLSHALAAPPLRLCAAALQLARQLCHRDLCGHERRESRPGWNLGASAAQRPAPGQPKPPLPAVPVPGAVGGLLRFEAIIGICVPTCNLNLSSCVLPYTYWNCTACTALSMCTAVPLLSPQFDLDGTAIEIAELTVDRPVLTWRRQGMAPGEPAPSA